MVLSSRHSSQQKNDKTHGTKNKIIHSTHKNSKKQKNKTDTAGSSAHQKSQKLISYTHSKKKTK